MFTDNSKMDDDNESVDLIPKIQELPIIQIFGFDGNYIKFPQFLLNFST